MARPRKDAEGPSAVERMEASFWEALAEKPYDQITVGEIARRAGLNRNAVYYHFDNLDALAAYAVGRMPAAELPGVFMGALRQGGVPFAAASAVEEVDSRLDKVLLLVGPHGSAQLVRMFHATFKRAWGEELGIDLSRASQEVGLAMEFILGGVTSLLTFQATHPRERVVDGFLRTDFAQVVFRSALALVEGGRRA